MAGSDASTPGGECRSHNLFSCGLAIINTYKESILYHCFIGKMSLRSSDAVLQHGFWSTLVRIMPWCLFGTKPLPELVLT